jgi:hypothetical protein
MSPRGVVTPSQTAASTSGSDEPASSYVQCKRWQSWRVGVDEMRQLAAAMMRDGLPGFAGMLVTSSKFTAEALAEGRRIGIELVDGPDPVQRLGAVGATSLLQRADPRSD